MRLSSGQQNHCRSDRRYMLSIQLCRRRSPILWHDLVMR
jgi:hypothetical protein